MAKRRPLHHTVRHHLKHWLVPHKHNDHRPHLIRRHGLLTLAAVIIAIQLAANVLIGPGVRVLGYASSITVADLLAQTNAERTAAGLPALTLDTHLNQSATLKSANMFSENYWAHVSPSGLQPWYWFQQAGYSYTYAGENLAKDFDTTSGVMQGWMNSPGHRANILNANYTDVGFSVQNGTLVGGQTTLIVAHYGASNVSSSPATTPAPAPVITAKPAARVTPAPTTPVISTPVPTAAPTPGVVAASPSVTPLALGTQPPSAPAAKNYSLFAPLSIVKTLSIGMLVTVLLLILLLGVYLATHLAVWRQGLRRWHTFRYKIYAIGSVIVLLALIIGLATSGFGKVG
jgi:uncharacterized protein YkwD